MKTRSAVIHSFTYHPPDTDQKARYKRINETLMDAALVIYDNTPESPERDIALREVKDALLHAFEAIACHENGMKHGV